MSHAPLSLEEAWHDHVALRIDVRGCLEARQTPFDASRCTIAMPLARCWSSVNRSP